MGLDVEYYSRQAELRANRNTRKEIEKLRDEFMKMMELKPLKYTIKEGGEWFPWEDEYKRTEWGIHSIMFDNGAIFDAVNGWCSKPT